MAEREKTDPFALGRPVVDVRRAGVGDMEAVVRIHQEAFPSSLMTLFGPRFLKMYYEEVLLYPGSVFLVAQEASGQLIGFVAGFRDPKSFYARLGRKKHLIGFTILRSLFSRPDGLRRLATAWYSYRTSASVSADLDAATGLATELASLAVSPSFQGRGWGALLVKHFLTSAFQSGSSFVYLTTDALRNDKVNSFYQRLGFRLVKIVLKGQNRMMNLYVYSKEDGS